MPPSSTTDVSTLVRRSVEIMRAGQSLSGAYVACPSFEPYRYCWLRDGSFVAEAMSRAGEIESAEAFFDWCGRLDGFDARYTLDGARDTSGWPRRQHDGWGLLLWAIRTHADRHGSATARWSGLAERTEGHLRAVRGDACTDWWEEREGIHGATLACIAAGLGEPLDLAPAEKRLDASLLVLPFLGFDLPRTVDELVSPGGGVHRHLEDTYYGGGEWLLLTALLGLASPERAEACLEWVAAHASANGELPEQSQDHLLFPAAYEPWVERWGPPASPLLWSHAMFVDLALSLA